MSLRLALFSLLLIALLKQKTARPIHKLTFETTKKVINLASRQERCIKKIFMMEFENEKSAALSFSFKFYDR